MNADKNLCVITCNQGLTTKCFHFIKTMKNKKKKEKTMNISSLGQGWMTNTHYNHHNKVVPPPCSVAQQTSSTAVPHLDPTLPHSKLNNDLHRNVSKAGMGVWKLAFHSVAVLHLSLGHTSMLWYVLQFCLWSSMVIPFKVHADTVTWWAYF